MKIAAGRSDCPIGKALDIIGDRWTLLIVRHMLFAGSTTYKELAKIPEHIASNILADRLDRLEKADIVRKLPDPIDRRANMYKLTEKGVDLLPILLAMIDWGMKYHKDASYPEELVARTIKNIKGRQ